MDGRADKMKSAPALSRRGGALVLRSITLFLASGRGAKAKKEQAIIHEQLLMRMGEKENKYYPKIIEAAKRDTSFTRSEIEALYKIYRKLVTMNRGRPQQDKAASSASNFPIGKTMLIQEGIDRIVFRELLHNTFDIITEEMLMDRIFCAWDKINAGLLIPETWFYGLNLFLKGNINEKIRFCFTVYDLNGDGYISKDEMFQLLKNCLIRQPQEEDPEESVKDLVEIVLRKLDKDKDGKVSLLDFQKSVMEEPLLLEAFGNCLPTERARDTFMATIRLQ